MGRNLKKWKLRNDKHEQKDVNTDVAYRCNRKTAERWIIGYTIARGRKKRRRGRKNRREEGRYMKTVRRWTDGVSR